MDMVGWGTKLLSMTTTGFSYIYIFKLKQYLRD